VKRVLFLAYHFPPIGGAGVQRNVKFARYLADFGYDPIVITGPGPVSDRWTPTDETLKADIRPGTEILRVEGPAPPPSGGWRGRMERLLMAQPPFASWWAEGALRVAREQAADVDLVYASLVPYSASEAAITLARELDKPLVVDLQDPWALDEMWIYPTAVQRLLDLRRMRDLFRSSDAVVMNVPEAVLRVRRRFPELDPETIFSITNGFDAADFKAEWPTREDDAFRIVHTGYLHTTDGLRLRRTGRLRRMLGGLPEPVDILTRSHLYLLEAIDQLEARRPDLTGKVELHLAGVLSEADRSGAEDRAAVTLHGYLSHAQTVALMRSADLLFLPMQNLPDGRPAGLTPGKTYEYLASGRPILGAVPDGDARELLLRAGTGRLCRPDDVAGMVAVLEAEIDRRRRGEPDPRANPEVLARFERRRLTEDLAGVFDSVLERRGLSRALRAEAA
jgi:glycosyltransferase involved in cell wall biosynthesis